MDRDAIVSKLRELGFSVYEALAYVALLEIGEGTAEEISRRSGIPLPRVYSVLESLEGKGFIEVLGGRPKRYSLQDPQRAIEEYLNVKRKEMEEEYNKLKRSWNEFCRMIEPYYTFHKLEIKPEELMVPLSDLEEAEKKTREIIEQATRSVLIMTNTFSWAERILDSLKRALKRGVEVRVLMRCDEFTRERVSKLRVLGVEIRAHPLNWYPVRCTITDYGKAVFVIWARPPIRGVGYIYRPHYTENFGMIKLLSDVFHLYWNRGSTI